MPDAPPARICFVLDMFGQAAGARTDFTIRVLLRALTEHNVAWLKQHPNTPLLYESGVRYQEEPPGAEDWQDIATCLALRWGDCEDLACWRAAELIVRGIAAVPVFTKQMNFDGSTLYHILVELPNGTIEDPSRMLGMR